MRILRVRTLIFACAMLALASLYIFHAPRAHAANGPFNGKIAFVRPPASSSDDAIAVMNVDGSGLTTLTNQRDFGPSWSFDGKKIAFTRNGDSLDIYVMNADGSGQ